MNRMGCPPLRYASVLLCRVYFLCGILSIAGGNFQTLSYQQSVLKDRGFRGYEVDMYFEMLVTITQQCVILPHETIISRYTTVNTSKFV